MAERRPPGFNVDLGFYDSDEVLSIPRKIRAAAIGVWTLAGSYSANKLSDGYVPAEKLKDFGCTPAIRTALMSTKPAPLWAPAEDVGAIQFTRWPRWQRTSAEVKAFKKVDAERKRRERSNGKTSSNSENAETSTWTSDGRTQTVQTDHGDPKTKTKTETKRGVTYVGNSPADDDIQPPPQFCPQHPEGTDSPCGACANARRKHDDWQNSKTLAGVIERQARLDGIAACPDCDDAGWALDESDAAVRCQHPTLQAVNDA